MIPAGPAVRAQSGAPVIQFSIRSGCIALLIWLTPAVGGPAFASSCASDRIDETAVVDYVHDGDTLHLQDGRKLRIIGIDTPELGRDGRRPERFAVTARNRLRELLVSGTGIGLRFDAERQDSYGRLLAHVFLENGTSVTAWLLERGLGTLLPVPPNLWNLECYRLVEQQAEKQLVGIWSLSVYRPAVISDVPPQATGYRVIRGRVGRVRRDDDTLRLEVAGRLVISIAGDDLRHFDSAAGSIPDWTGRLIEARGWLVRRNDRFHMRVRHPVSLRILE